MRKGARWFPTGPLLVPLEIGTCRCYDRALQPISPLPRLVPPVMVPPVASSVTAFGNTATETTPPAVTLYWRDRKVVVKGNSVNLGLILILKIFLVFSERLVFCEFV